MLREKDETDSFHFGPQMVRNGNVFLFFGRSGLSLFDIVPFLGGAYIHETDDFALNAIYGMPLFNEVHNVYMATNIAMHWDGFGIQL